MWIERGDALFVGAGKIAISTANRIQTPTLYIAASYGVHGDWLIYFPCIAAKEA